MKRPGAVLIASLVLLLFAAFVWPTPYKFVPSPDPRVLTVRVNRVTQAVDYCTPAGWDRAARAPDLIDQLGLPAPVTGTP